MKISPPRRAIYKQNIRALILANPRVKNIELSSKIGLHRNTISKLVNEIKNEDRDRIQKIWRYNLKNLLHRGDTCNKRLSELYAKAYPSYVFRKPSQLVNIIALDWKISRESYKEVLRYLGVREDPKALIQVNFANK